MVRWLHSTVGLQVLEVAAVVVRWLFQVVTVATEARLSPLGHQYLPGAGCTAAW